MINNRVLELLKNPKNIQSEDLHLLKEEINSFPYIQNIRALHLYGVNLYDKENYQKTLSSTAAYTTDKKILYHLINGKIQQVKPEDAVEKQEVVSEKINENIIVETTFAENIAGAESENLPEETSVRSSMKSFSDHDYEAATEGLIADKPEIKHLVVKGERNRILFDGEENFLDEDNNETIDLESTLESGVIVTHKSVSNQNNTDQSDKEEAIVAEELAGTSSEPEISETPIPETQVEEVTDNAELNLEEILPESDLNKTEETTEVLNPEIIIEEEKIESSFVSEKINDNSELSFHATDSFLPEVKIESKKTLENLPPETQNLNINKHEHEMRRLIEEVEKRMKERKENTPEKVEIKEEEINHDISFAETQAFHLGEEQKAAEEVVVKEAESIVEEKLEEEKYQENNEEVKEEVLEKEPETENTTAWKPMSFETSRPDSFYNRPVEFSQPKEEVQNTEEVTKPELTVAEIPDDTQSENVEISDNLDENVNIETEEEEKNNDAPVMNVSFFGSGIASLGLSYKSDQKEKAEAKELEAKIAQKKIDDSNVPGFINTWQSWLKIDRAEETPIDKTEIKNKVIESFIENNPKISQLKDEVNFVVKEKTDDISHLMTETLANLYIEQKLYSKAVNAFLVLANKFPDRKEYFESKIQEIKDNRSKN